MASCSCSPPTDGDELVQTLPLYVYKPLPTSRSFRLFRLEAGEPNTVIRGHLYTANFDEEPIPYLALSYVWGSSETPHTILCDGKRIMIGCNLHSALHRLRKNATNWFVDAICINQSPEALEERSSQVRLMGEVYQRTEQVIIDLSEPIEDIDSFTYLASSLCNFTNKEWEDFLENPNPLGTHRIPPFNADIWSTFISVFQRPWFERVWVLQEFALPQSAAFMLGNEIIPDFGIRNSIRRAYRLTDWLHEEGSPFYDHAHEKAILQTKLHKPMSLMNAFACLSERSEILPEQRKSSLEFVLSLTEEFKATDTRDKVYALLGLIQQPDMSTFRIHYREPLNALERRISQLLLEQGSITELLYDLSSRSATAQSSWVVSLGSCRRSSGIERYIDEAKLHSWFNAGGGGSDQYQLEDNGFKLTLKGIIVDEIIEVLDAFPAAPHDAADLDDARLKDLVIWYDTTLFEILIRRTRHSDSEEDLEKLLNEYLMVITAGAHQVGMPDKTLSRDDLQALHEYCHRPEDKDWNLLAPEIFSEKFRSLSRSQSAMSIFCDGKCIGLTENDSLCLVPQTAEPGDFVIVLHGFLTPFLMRPQEDGYKLLGAIYQNNYMHGEAFTTAGLFEKNIDIY